MANELVITAGLTANKGNLHYASQNNGFQADMSGTKGPSPGAISVSIEGTDVEFSQLTDPGWCRMINLDSTNYVEFGIWDPENSKFFPIGILRPGKVALFEISPNLQEEFNTGTGTTGANTNRLRLRANGAPCNVIVDAFES